MKFILSVIVLGALSVSSPSFAAEITQSAVQNFSNEMNEAHNKPYEQYVTLIDAAFTPESTFVIQDKLSVPGQPVKETNQNLSKPQYMNDLKSGYDLLQGAKVQYQISDIKISPDKQKAVLKDRTLVQNNIPVPGGNKTQKMNFTSAAICETDLVLSSSAKLQANKTICDSQTNVVLPSGMLQ